MPTALNPYAEQLGDLTYNKFLPETAERLRSLVDTLGESGLKRTYAPGKWTALEIICHLADTEIAFAFRLRQTLAEPHHIIQPFDQEAWSKLYSSLPARAALDLFSELRRWNLTLIAAAGPAALSKTVNHPERGEMVFETILETMASHDRNHLRQLDTIAAQQD